MPPRPPDMPRWFKPLFFTWFIINIVFILWASIYIYLGMNRLDEFWAVDSRNMWIEIKSNRKDIDEMTEDINNYQRGYRDGSDR